MVHIVKRRGHKEPFDSHKVYGSVYAACRNAHLSEMQSEKIAGSVAQAIEKWIARKITVTSEEIFLETANVLRALHEDAAFLYATHRDVA